MLSDDPKLRLNHREHVQCGTAVQTGRLKASAAGCTGLSAFAELETFDYTSFFVLPVAHMMLFGLVCDFLRHILHEPGSKGQRAAAAAKLATAEAAAAAAAGGSVDGQAADSNGAVGREQATGAATAAATAAAACVVGVLSAEQRREI
jgi:hypothetical protein